MSKSKTIITSTTALSQLATEICAQQEARGPLSKQTILNAAAKVIAGPKHDWGYMTGAEGVIIQKGLPAARLDDLAILRHEPQTQRAPHPFTADPDRPEIEVQYQKVPLLPAHLAGAYADQLGGDFLCISEEFYCEDGTPAPTFDSRAICTDESKAITALPILTDNLDHIRRFSQAKTIAQSAKDVNGRITESIQKELSQAITETFRTYLLPYALIVMPDYPFQMMLEEGGPEWDNQDAIDMHIAVFLDKDLNPEQEKKTISDVEDLLLRVNYWLAGDKTDETLSRIHLIEGHPSEPKKYVICDEDASWSHIDSTGEEHDVRWVYDRDQECLIAAQYCKAGKWTPVGRTFHYDLEDSIKDANADIIDDPDQYYLKESRSIPDWTIAMLANALNS